MRSRVKALPHHPLARRKFTLTLTRNPDINIGAIKFVGVGDEGSKPLDMSHLALYRGSLGKRVACFLLLCSQAVSAEGAEKSAVSFSVTNDNRIRGVVYTETETYHIDPAEDHFGGESVDFDHVIYRLSDMSFDP